MCAEKSDERSHNGVEETPPKRRFALFIHHRVRAFRFFCKPSGDHSNGHTRTVDTVGHAPAHGRRHNEDQGICSQKRQAVAELIGLLASAYQFSYRLALLAADSLILIVAAAVGWRMSYGIYGTCMAVGIIATWFAKEPERSDPVMHKKEREAPLWTPRGFFDAVVGPFIAFFRAHGWLALVMLAAISLYRLPDFIMGPMANPYYHDMGLSKQTVGAVRGSIGLIATFAGIAAGGFCSLKLGHMR